MIDTFIFSAWIGVFGFISGMLVQVITSSAELKAVKAELKQKRAENAELKKQLKEYQESETIEVIEITDNTIKDADTLFDPF